MHIDNVGDSTVFARVIVRDQSGEETKNVLRFDGSSLSEVALPQEKGKSKKVFTGSDYGTVRNFTRKGQSAFYSIFGTDAIKGTGVYRAQATTGNFEPVLPASEANKLENIYNFAVLPGSPDKIAIAAKTKTKDGKTTGGKYVIIELDANGNVLRRSPELDMEIDNVFFWH